MGVQHRSHQHGDDAHRSDRKASWMSDRQRPTRDETRPECQLRELRPIEVHRPRYRERAQYHHAESHARSGCIQYARFIYARVSEKSDGDDAHEHAQSDPLQQSLLAKSGRLGRVLLQKLTVRRLVRPQQFISFGAQKTGIDEGLARLVGGHGLGRRVLGFLHRGHGAFAIE